MSQKYKDSVWLQATALALVMAAILLLLIIGLKPKTEKFSAEDIYYDVISVVDGDTIKINYDGKETSVRLIGVNAPETVDPRTTVECFGQEASDYLRNLLSGRRVKIEADSVQTDKDKYGRLLRYVYLDNEDVGLDIISNGYGYEYTYDLPYKKQEVYKTAQAGAEKNGRGLWEDGVCGTKNQESINTNVPEGQSSNSVDSAPSTSTSTGSAPNYSTDARCSIKGNINYNGEKIYHVPGQEYYDSTVINTDYGERWFCSEEEALAAGWRKSKV